MARSDDSEDAEAERRKRYDRPEAAGQYGSLDDRLGYGGGRDPGNLSEHGREATTHDYGGDPARDEHGWEGGSRPADAGEAADRAGDEGRSDEGQSEDRSEKKQDPRR